MRPGLERLETTKPPVFSALRGQVNQHKNARLTFSCRLETVRVMTEHLFTPANVAAA